ncbi:uncharacterized protein TNCV_3557951 [Trichonephila clavipes]|uniref:Uncharacterized protein n=1 Tax=Trichonephila clavipes TaxID=2585209 RepID=A0A8X6WC66_TRICX|nr:uncharacterized protein TNCV_3557951 [Trichonephila clavipes]
MQKQPEDYWQNAQRNRSDSQGDTSSNWSPGKQPPPYSTFILNKNFSPSVSYGMNINVALFSYTRAFGDGPRNFRHGQVTWTASELASPLLTTTPHQWEDVSDLDRFNVHRCPTRRVFSGTGLELMTYLP